MVGKESFIKLFDIADRKLTVKHPTTYSRMMNDTAQNVLSKVCQIIAIEKSQFLSVGVTTDLWTSRAGDSYISLTLSWINLKWEMLRFTPFVHPFPGRHTGNRISVELDDMFEELQFDATTDKVCVSDNAANMKVALKKSDHLREYFCNIHTLQLGIEDTFKNVDGMRSVLAKCKEIAKFCHQSTVAMDQLRDTAKRCGVSFKKPKNPNKTRWDSQYETMCSIHHLKAAIEDLETTETDWEVKALTRSEWKLLEGALKVLHPFKETTKVWQYEAIPTINLVIERIYHMEQNLIEFINNKNNDKFGITFAKELRRNLDKRFPSHGLHVFERRAANYLDPCLKGIHLRKFQQFEATKEDLENLYKRTEDDDLAVGAEENVDNNNAATEVVGDKELSPTSKLKFEFELPVAEEIENCKIRKEMLMFEKMEAASKEENVLGWWKSQEKHLPLLAKLARRILAIPASSGKSERVFSTGGNFVKEKRTRLNALKVQSLIIIKENRAHVDHYLSMINQDKFVAAEGENAFEKVKVKTIVGILNDDELSSDTEYYADDD